MLHDLLWERNIDLAGECLDHPFVRRLGEGTLNPDCFRRYIAQDAFFLESFLRAYAVAGAKCADLRHVKMLHEFMTGALEELKMHAGYVRSLGIDLTQVRPYPATRAYVDFLQAMAWHEPPGVTLAAMTPCMRLYAYIGSALAAASPPRNPFQDWIETYAGEDFRAVASDVESLLDALADDQPAVHDAYRYAMQCELAFFSAPMEDEA
ncbi:MAG: TenA family protein [Phycisphaerae bacterium]|nr:TenA family protein [Phycisphaerae bacterium]